MHGTIHSTADVCVGSVLVSALLVGLLWLLPAPDSACAQLTSRWPQLNAWSSEPLLRPVALLLHGC